MTDPTLRTVQLDDKDIDEHDDLIFQLTDLRDGETFTTVDIARSIEVLFGTDTDPETMFDGAAEVGSYEGLPAIFQRVRGGVVGAVYLVRFTLTLSSGRVLLAAIRLRVRRVGA